MSPPSDSATADSASSADGTVSEAEPRALPTETRYVSPEDILSDSQRVHLKQWADHTDVYGWLTSLSERNQDPVEFARDVRTILRDLPPGAQSVRLGKICERSRTCSSEDSTRGNTTTPPPENAHDLIEMQGAVEYPLRSKMRYVVPGYRHFEHTAAKVSPDETREEQVRRTAAYGVLDKGDVAVRFGMSVPEFEDWLDDAGVDWAALRDDGKRRFARSMWTNIAWGHHSFESIVSAFPISEDTLSAWFDTYCRGGYVPPEDPSGQGWFQIR